jgi:hypothetical protein
VYISFVLNRIVNWLEQHRLVNVLLIIAYSVFIILMHNNVVHLSVFVMQNLTLPVYNTVVKIIFSAFAVLYCGLLAWQLNIYSNQRKAKIIYLVCTFAFIIFHFWAMFEMNIEIIHIYEYPLLCFLFYPFTRRFGASLLFTLPFMLIDEWRQYMILYPGYVEYLELNDVMTDVYGCGLAVVTMWICNVKTNPTCRPIWQRPEFIMLGLMVLAFFIALKTCFFCLYPEDACSNTYMVLDKLQDPGLFWRQYPNRDVIYHVSTPIEGVIIISLLCLFYFGIDSLARKKAA